MKHRAWVWTLLLLLMVMLGQGARAERPTPPPLVEVPVTEADIGQPIALAADELLVLTLEANPSTGYRWEVAAADAEIVQLVAGYDFVQTAPGYGQAGLQTLRFVPLAAGDATVRLVYRRPWEQAQPPLRELTFTVQTAGATTAEIPLLLNDFAPQTSAVPLQDAVELTSLPTTLNWCDHGYCTPVKNQADCGSCWAFSTVSIFESALRIWDNTTRDLSEQYLVSCNMNGWGCGGGSYAHDYHANVSLPGELPGPVYEADFPYQAADAPCNIPYTHHERLESWAYGIDEVAAIKQLIYDYGPVSASMCAGAAFQAYSGGIFDTNETCFWWTNHAVVLVGWDDTEQVWYLRNSWGPEWGENGYMRIRWGTSNVGSSVNHVVYGVPRNLTVSALSASQLRLDWVDFTSAEAGFKVERSPDGSTDWTEVAVLGANANSYIDSGRACNTPYYYRVRGYKDTFHTDYTMVVGATTTGCSGVPAAPSGLNVTQASVSQLNLSWTDNSSDELGFDIERSPDGVTGWTQIAVPGAGVTAYPDSGLRCNTTYFYRVRAYNAMGYSAYTNVASDTTGDCPLCPDIYEPDDAPTTASAITTDGVPQTHTFNRDGDEDWVSFPVIAPYTYTVTTSSWGANNDPYLYLYDPSGEGIVTHGAQLAWAADQSGTYYIRALHRNQQGGCEGYSYDLTILQSLLPLQVPAAPSHLTATAASSNGMDITWRDNSDNEDGFKIEHSWDSVNWSHQWTVGANGTAITIIGYTCGTTAYYRVHGYNAAGDSASSNAAWAMTFPCAGSPSAPTGLSIAPISGAQLDLSWSDNSSDETHFVIERSPDGANNWALLATTTVDATTYSDTDLVCQTPYYYRVQAHNANGGSDYALGSGVTLPCNAPPAAPSGLSATAASDTQIDLSWTDNSADEAGFEIERSPDGTSGWEQIALVNANVTAYQDVELTCSTLYYYRVRAFNGAGISEHSNILEITTAACSQNTCFIYLPLVLRVY